MPLEIMDNMNSAASIMAVARDPQKSGILALRGKLINALSNPPEKVLENEEVKLIMSALNVRPNSYRPSKLRYGKIGITTDADADGSHIALLIMAFFQAYLPEFLKEGRLYWLRAPLHIRNLKSKDFFYYSDEELKNAAEKGGTLSRAKGLGSLTPNQAKEALFGENRRFEPLKFTEESFETLEDLMGKEVDPRREFVFNKIDFSSIRE